jgi:hypothetical protein
MRHAYQIAVHAVWLALATGAFAQELCARQQTVNSRLVTGGIRFLGRR